MSKRNLDSLGDFQTSYSSKFQQAGGAGLRVTQLAEYRGFLEKICTAIAEQHLAIQRAESEVLRDQDIWLQARQKTDGIRKLMDKTRIMIQKAEDKREQLDMDDRSSRVFRSI